MVDWIRSMLDSLLARTSPAPGKGSGEPGSIALDPNTLKRMVREIAHTHEHEIACQECFRLPRQTCSL